MSMGGTKSSTVVCCLFSTLGRVVGHSKELWEFVCFNLPSLHRSASAVFVLLSH